MRKTSTLIVAALLTTVSTVALAQSNTPAAQSTTPPTTQSSNSTAAKAPSNTANFKQQVTTDLQKAGFTNVKVKPDSFLIQANDKSGNPVTMFITPDSMAEVTTVGSNQSTSGGTFANIPAQDDLSSKVVGLDVYNDANQDIGTVKDIAFNGSDISGYIVSVGGFLGIGDHYVAVHPDALNISYNSGDKKWHAKMNATADQLKAAPEYKYPSKG